MRPRAAAWQTICYLLGNNLPNNWSKIWRNAIFKFCVTTVIVLQSENKQTRPLVLVLADFIIRSLPPSPPAQHYWETMWHCYYLNLLQVCPSVTLVVFSPIHVLSCYFYVPPLNSEAVPTVWIVIIGTLRYNDADGNENVKKTIGFISKTTTLHVHHAFLYISFPVFARLRRENA